MAQSDEFAVVPSAGGEVAPTTLSFARAPELVLEDATHAAKLLKGVVDQTNAKITIGKSEHLKIEAWLTVASFYSVVPRVVSHEFIVRGDAHGYEVVAEAVDVATGRALSRAVAMCLNDEENWSSRPKYEWEADAQGKKHKVYKGEVAVPHQQRLSMAQTRACSKVLSIPFRRVVTLAGYDPTPAEEIADGTPPIDPGNGRETKPPIQQPKPAHNGGNKPANGNTISKPQMSRLWALAYKRHVDKEAVTTAVNRSLERRDLESVSDVTKADYDQFVKEVSE